MANARHGSCAPNTFFRSSMISPCKFRTASFVAWAIIIGCFCPDTKSAAPATATSAEPSVFETLVQQKYLAGPVLAERNAYAIMLQGVINF